MSKPSDDRTAEEVLDRYLLEINRALGELTLDEVRQVFLELEAHQSSPAISAGSVVN